MCEYLWFWIITTATIQPTSTRAQHASRCYRDNSNNYHARVPRKDTHTYRIFHTGSGWKIIICLKMWQPLLSRECLLSRVEHFNELVDDKDKACKQNSIKAKQKLIHLIHIKCQECVSVSIWWQTMAHCCNYSQKKKHTHTHSRTHSPASMRTTLSRQREMKTTYVLDARIEFWIGITQRCLVLQIPISQPGISRMALHAHCHFSLFRAR